ncbi:hypothetical protein [Anaerofustis sp. NSJ-163]|uniref:hypothetical protein n=1 Tax=Anaerofustis sp. NSJ-163 TaxID=2944391 RepID=UPI00209C16B3|nr:hypothetical protein [Anaerofustis sp. NSJ-163]MCO8193019.1 hypothetical protein [Anaerofustis sp. NSJ-163]
MKKNSILKELAMCTPILLLIALIFFVKIYDYSVTGDLNNKCYEYLTAEDGSGENYKNILQMMYPKPTFGIKYVNRKVDYDIVEKTKEIEKKKIEDLYLGTKEIEKEYDKVKIKVTSYNYALAYKNAVKATNKYIEENKNASKEEIEKYFANRLEYEGRKVIKNKEKTVMYVYKKEDAVVYDSSRGGHVAFEIVELPGQKDNLDFLNAMLGGLVEEMDRTKLPEGVDLEETLQLMGIE